MPLWTLRSAPRARGFHCKGDLHSSHSQQSHPLLCFKQPLLASFRARCDLLQAAYERSRVFAEITRRYYNKASYTRELDIANKQQSEADEIARQIYRVVEVHHCGIHHHQASSCMSQDSSVPQIRDSEPRVRRGLEKQHSSFRF